MISVIALIVGFISGIYIAHQLEKSITCNNNRNKMTNNLDKMDKKYKRKND